jgi:hypothetical protein
MVRSSKRSPAQIWRASVQSPEFRKKLITGLAIITIILSIFPFFFQAIEKRHGYLINDWVLNYLPAHNVSPVIFFFIWTTTVLIVIRLARDPEIFLKFLWSYILLCLFRMLTITLVALETPPHLIPITDPLANAFYGPSFITKDLFFSGHTGTVLLMAFCLKNKYDKIYAYIATTFVGFLLLVQHVHYTIDVIAAPFLTWIVYLGGKRISTIESRKP